MKKIESIISLQKKAHEMRQDVIRMLARAGSGHSAGPLDLAELLTALYFNVMRYDSRDPHWSERDRLISSAGHTVPIRYVAMAHAGLIPKGQLKKLRQFGSPLQGHPSRDWLSAIETSTGPLGQGLSVATGMALAGLWDRKDYFVYVIVSDGELNEGQCWEAFMFAAKYRLRNLIVFIDRNHIQIDGRTEEVMPLGSVKDKLTNFGWHCLSVDGHSVSSILDAVRLSQRVDDRPSAIILNTIPGRGVSFMENNYEWHGKAPSEREAGEALRQLRTLQGTIDSSDIL